MTVLKAFTLITLVSCVLGAPPAGATPVSDTSEPSGGQTKGRKSKSGKGGWRGGCEDRAGWYYEIGASITNYDTKRYSECTWSGWQSWEMCPAGERIADRSYCWSSCYPFRGYCRQACKCEWRRRAEETETEETQLDSEETQLDTEEDRRRAAPAGATKVSDNSEPSGGVSTGTKTKSGKSGVGGWCRDRAGYWYRVGASITNYQTKRYSECTWSGWESWEMCPAGERIADRSYCWSRCYPFRGYCRRACRCEWRRRAGETETEEATLSLGEPLEPLERLASLIQSSEE